MEALLRSKRYLLIRSVLILAVLSWLVTVNPANEAAYLFPKRGILKPKDRYAMRRTTNYLFFAVQERTVEVTIRVAGQRWNCPYDVSSLTETWSKKNYLCILRFFLLRNSKVRFMLRPAINFHAIYAALNTN